jgi:hypothetical protein
MGAYGAEFPAATVRVQCCSWARLWRVWADGDGCSGIAGIRFHAFTEQVSATRRAGIAFGYVVSQIRQDLNDNRAGLLVQAVRARLD